MSNQTLAELIDMLYEARLRNPENPFKELEEVHRRDGKNDPWRNTVCTTREEAR